MYRFLIIKQLGLLFGGERVLRSTDQSSTQATSGVHIWQTSLFARGWSVLVGEAADQGCSCWPTTNWQRCSSDSVQTAMLHNLMVLSPLKDPGALCDRQNLCLFCKTTACIHLGLYLYRERLCSAESLQMEYCCCPKDGFHWSLYWHLWPRSSLC